MRCRIKVALMTMMMMSALARTAKYHHHRTKTKAVQIHGWLTIAFAAPLHISLSAICSAYEPASDFSSAFR